MSPLFALFAPSLVVPPAGPRTLPPVSATKELGWRVAPSECGFRPNARTVVFHLPAGRRANSRTAPFQLLRRLLTLLKVHYSAWGIHRPVGGAVFCIDETNALALRISEQVVQLDQWHGGFTPALAALIARRELGRELGS